MLFDQIIDEVKIAVNLDNQYILNEAKKHHSFIGIMRNNGSWPDIKRCRSFYEPSALYSHQHGPNTAAIAQLRTNFPGYSNHGNDLYVIDNEGLVSNSTISDSTLKRLSEAYLNKKKVILINTFLGSVFYYFLMHLIMLDDLR